MLGADPWWSCPSVAPAALVVAPQIPACSKTESMQEPVPAAFEFTPVCRNFTQVSQVLSFHVCLLYCHACQPFASFTCILAMLPHHNPMLQRKV